MISLQELFKLVQSGDRNAFGEIHRRMRIHMHPDPNVGVFTQLYLRYNVNDEYWDELNQAILVVVWEKIMDGQLSEMNGWGELKSYSSTVCVNKCKELLRMLSKREFDKSFEDDVSIDLEVINELRLEQMVRDIMNLNSEKCRSIWDLSLLGKKNDEIFNKLKNRMKFKDVNALKSYKSKCRQTLIEKARNHANYKHWRSDFDDFFSV